MTAAEARRAVRVQWLELARSEDFWIRTSRTSGRGTDRLVWDMPALDFLRLASAVELRRRLDAVIGSCVARERAAGATWDEIALALGVTGEAARQRFREGGSDGEG